MILDTNALSAFVDGRCPDRLAFRDCLDLFQWPAAAGVDARAPPGLATCVQKDALRPSNDLRQIVVDLPATGDRHDPSGPT